ncbi:MAG: hypothetical protein WA047_13525 [Phenylobacterium sp.]|uniref:DUF4870 family protein n=1 Tax=Phenylobacterium sp. TaxID=1871053 RepID=UPI003BB7C380
MSERLDTGTVNLTEDKTLPMVAYVLYLLTFASGFTVFVGLIIAYANRATAGPKMESHYTFMIRTFWLSIAWAVIGGMLCLLGAPLSLVLVGIPFFLLGLFILGALGIWFAARCIIGLLHLSRGEAYPRPMNWLI